MVDAVTAKKEFSCSSEDLAGATVEVAWSSDELDEQQWPTGKAQEPLEPDVAKADRPEDAAKCSSPNLAFRTLTGSRSVEKALHVTEGEEARKHARMIYCRLVLGTWRPPPMPCH